MWPTYPKRKKAERELLQTCIVICSRFFASTDMGTLVWLKDLQCKCTCPLNTNVIISLLLLNCHAKQIYVWQYRSLILETAWDRLAIKEKASFVRVCSILQVVGSEESLDCPVTQTGVAIPYEHSGWPLSVVDLHAVHSHAVMGLWRLFTGLVILSKEE